MPLQQFEDELVKRPDRVIVVAGIGVSLASCGNHQCASWKGLLTHGLQTCEEQCGTPPTTLNAYRQIVNDPSASTHALIGVGQFVTDELNARRPGAYGKWLADSIGTITQTDKTLVAALASLGAKLATTNYDNMLEDGTGCSPITWRDRALAANFFRETPRDVLHLHGHYRQPSSIILGARSYGEICNDEFAQTALRGIMISGTLLFVGCGAGLEDPNFGVLLEWARSVLAECHHSHFILVRRAESEDWRRRLSGMPIHPIPYGADYAELVPFLGALATRARERRSPEPLFLLARSQTDFEAQWEELDLHRQDLSALEYFRRSRALAADLWNAGGHRRAAMAFSHRLLFRGQDLLISEHVEFSLDAAEWLLNDDLPSLASTHLAAIAGKLETADAPRTHFGRFRHLRIRCMEALCAYNELLQAIEDALAGASPEVRARLEAERSEIHFLQGKLPQAAADPE